MHIFKKLLLQFGILFDHPFLICINRVFQKLYVGPLKNYIWKRLQKVSEHEIILITRNSVTQNSGFNIFFSDIDFTIVVKSEISFEYSDRILKTYGKLKKFFPMLGEVEFFTEPEWSELEGLWKSDGALLRLLLD